MDTCHGPASGAAWRCQWSGCCGEGGPMIRAVRDPGKQCSPLHNRTGARSAARSDHRMSRWQEICDKLVNSVCEPAQPDLNLHSHHRGSVPVEILFSTSSLAMTVYLSVMREKVVLCLFYGCWILRTYRVHGIFPIRATNTFWRAPLLVGGFSGNVPQ